MKNILEKGLIEAGYFLSRMGVSTPPDQLNASSWKEAYLKFYNTFGMGKTEEEFKNSLNNIRDHFDRHLVNNRTGWQGIGPEGKLSESKQQVFDELGKLNSDLLWQRIKPYVVTSHDLKLSQKKIKQVSSSQAKFFSSEFSGKRKIGAKAAAKAFVSHGLVVDSLKVYVDEYGPEGFTYNTQKIDLALEVDQVLQRIYEVKTSTDSQSIYTAVGQLYMHSAGAEDIEKWMVLPGPDENTVLLNCLQALDISVLWYQLEEDGLCRFEPTK